MHLFTLHMYNHEGQAGDILALLAKAEKALLIPTLKSSYSPHLMNI